MLRLNPQADVRITIGGAFAMRLSAEFDMQTFKPLNALRPIDDGFRGFNRHNLSMKNTLILAAVLITSPHVALAMSLAAAGENILYFEHAKLSSEHCERRGISTNAAFARWQEKNISLYRATVAAIRFEAGKRGLSEAEQEMILADSIENQKKLAREHITKQGVNCAKFDAALQMYSELLKR
jgi:hypothetical protein